MKTRVMVLVAMVMLAVFCSARNIAIASIPPQYGDRPTKVHKKGRQPIAFKLSGYYRVQKHQKRYATGSYRGDVRLNGIGITHSDKLAKVGHLAADLRWYPMGTKIRLFIDGKDHGVWTVEDKGPAIKGRHRLDGVFGAGDDGLSKAMKWGMGEGHTVIGYVVEWGHRDHRI